MDDFKKEKADTKPQARLPRVFKSHNTTTFVSRLHTKVILDQIPGVSKVFWISRYFKGIILGYFQGIYKVFSSMRVGTRLCQRLAVAQSTLTSLIEQRPTTFRAPHRPRRPRQSPEVDMPGNTKYNINTYDTKILPSSRGIVQSSGTAMPVTHAIP